MSDPDPSTAGTRLPRRGSLRWLHLLVVLAVLGAAVPLLVVLVGVALPLVTDELEGDTYVSASVPLIGLPEQPPSGLVPGVSLSPGEPVSVAIKIPTPRQYNLALLTQIPYRAVYLAFFVLLLSLIHI